MDAEGGTTEGALTGAEDGNTVAIAGASPDVQANLTDPATSPPEQT